MSENILRPGDYVIAVGENEQLIKMSISDDTKAGYIDFSISRTQTDIPLPDAKVRMFISKEDTVDKVFNLDGDGINNNTGSVVYIQADELRFIPTSSKSKIQSAVLGDELYNVLDQILLTLIKHVHPMESQSVDTIPKWKSIRKNLRNILSEHISVG